MSDKPDVAANFKILLIGESSVGKSSLLERFISDDFKVEKQATIGVDFNIKMIPLKDGSCVKLSIWDTAGQERFRALTPSYYRGSHGVLFIFDLSNGSSFEKIVTWVNEANKYIDKEKGVRYLVGNKVDRTPREVNRDEAVQLAVQNGMVYAETSAKTAEGVRNLFFELVEKIYARPEIWSSQQSKNSVAMANNSFEQKCCSINN